MRACYLVCYDIADRRRLRRVYRFLKGHGVPLQYSVFLCSFTWPELQTALSHLNQLIETAADDVRIDPLPAGQAIMSLGCGDRTPAGTVVVLP